LKGPVFGLIIDIDQCFLKDIGRIVGGTPVPENMRPDG
jgi:hypothetical protein